MEFDDLMAEREYRSMKVYGRSKLANILFTTELAKRLAGTGVTANSLHPGSVATGYARDGDTTGFMAWGIEIFARLPISLSPEQGARTSVYLCSSPEVAGVTGTYFAKCRPKTPSANARDEAAAARLWAVSEELVAGRLVSRVVAGPRPVGRGPTVAPRSEGLALTQLGDGLGHGLLGGGRVERLPAAGVGPQLGNPPEQDADPDRHTPDRPTRRRTRDHRWRRPHPSRGRRGGSTGHHGEEGARQATLEVVGHGPLLHVLAEDRRDHVGAPGHGQEGQAHPQHGNEPTTAMVPPQTTTQAAMARPWWRIRAVHPVNREPTRAPAPGAA